MGLVIITGCGRVGFGTESIHDAVPADELPMGPPLVDRGVVARYFLDEADAGRGPQLAHDATPDPFDLPIVYDADGDPTWTMTPGGRALAFAAFSLDGGPCAVLGSKLLARLSNIKTATIEVVAEYVACHTSASRYVGLGTGGEWGFSLGCYPPSTVHFAFNEPIAGSGVFWTVDQATRKVLTLVLDTLQPNVADRTRLYSDGARIVQAGAGLQPTLGQDLVLNATQSLCLGNRIIGDRNPIGTLGYVALYAAALSDAEVAANAARLALTDDR